MWVVAVLVPFALLLLPLALHRLELSLDPPARPRRSLPAPVVHIPEPRRPLSERSHLAVVPAVPYPRGA